MLRLTTEPPRRRESAMPESSRLLFGLALLLTILADGAANHQFTALSTVITAHSDPSALQQLATFAAMEDVAEEEHLDWGSSGRLVRAQPSTLAKPRDAVPPEPAKLHSAAPHSHSRSNSEDVLSDGLSKSLTETLTDAVAGASSSSAASSAASSHRRPHRRHHRRSGTASDATSSAAASSLSSGEVAVEVGESRPVHSYPMWTQFHVMELAYSTGANNFVHITERFVEYQQMFPIVYRCDLSKVDCPYEADLLAAPTVGLAASSRWVCASCGRKHDVVRESCLRCRAAGPYTKLFVGQAVKEVDCTESVLRFLHATHPDVVVHRAECHHDAGVAGRGKGCASIYVRREDAATVQEKLHRNAFFDVDAVTGELLVYYVYTEQQAWLHSFVQQRVAVPDQRPLFLPLAPLVVEESAAPSTSMSKRPGGRGRGCQRPAGDCANSGGHAIAAMK
ncbi:hypothetical protein NESM_000730400 [Novymonas esmeraldas]|uniref:RanBP2-type domain-containing protein n=1 Tax=Novymonas esmeraldas TaxID=1808958 RepID=A0AAW0EVF8_9TRYP